MCNADNTAANKLKKPVATFAINVVSIARDANIAVPTRALITIVGIANIQAAVAQKKDGTLDRLLIAPIRPYTIILAKLFYASFLGIFQLLVMFIFGWLVFGLDIFFKLLNNC